MGSGTLKKKIKNNKAASIKYVKRLYYFTFFKQVTMILIMHPHDTTTLFFFCFFVSSLIVSSAVASVNARPFLLPVYQGSKFSLSPLDWEGEKNSLSANDFTSFLNGWKVIPYELLQNKHSYFIVLTALSLIVPIKERCQCYFFFVSVQELPTSVSWGGAKAASDTLVSNEQGWKRMQLKQIPG